MGAGASQSADGQTQASIFVGTVIADEGANLRSGPSLDYAIVDKWSEGQQFPFEMASEDKEWLRINEGLWISASTVAEQEIYETSLPADGDCPEYPMPIIKTWDLGQSFAIPEGDKIFLGSVSVEDGANIRSGPGLEHKIVSAVSFGSLVAWIAMSQDRAWFYLQNGHWISADLVSDSRIFRIINTDKVMGPAAGIPIIDPSQEQIGQSLGPSPLATVISETGAGIRSGPGLMDELVAAKSLGQKVAYVAQSKNGDWILLEDGNWIAAYQVSTEGFGGTDELRVSGGYSVPSFAEGLEFGEVSGLSIVQSAPRQQAYQYVNEVRTWQGLSPVRLGKNPFAQIQSDEIIKHRTLSPWTMAGLTPAMLYTLEGGEGYRESSTTHMGYLERTDCIFGQDPANFFHAMLDFLEDNPRLQEKLQRPEHTTVNVGLSFNCRAMALVLELEGEYVSYLKPPAIQEGQLTMEGRLLNGANMIWIGEDVGIWIHYLPPPVPLTRGQMFRGGAECLGIPVAAVMTQRPIYSTNEDIEKGFERSAPRCLPPYAIDPHSEPPQNEKEARQLLNDAANTFHEGDPEAHFGPMILPDFWQVHQDRFAIQVDVSSILAEHGPGVYSINLVGSVDDIPINISGCAIFVE